MSQYYDSADSTLRWFFSFFIDFLKWLVKLMKNIPTGFGVNLYTFCIVCLITGVVVTGIVNVVKVASFTPHTEQGRAGRETAKAIKKDMNRYESNYDSWFED